MKSCPAFLRFLIAVVILSMLAMPATASAPSALDQAVRAATLPPALDGNLSDWDGVPVMVVDHDTRALGSSAPVERFDALYTLQMLETPDALYLGFHARDDKLVADSGAELHKDDGLRFSVDGNKDGLGGAASDHAFRIRIDTKVNDAGGPEIKSLTVATATVPGGYNMEVKIPASVLALPLGSTGFKFNWAGIDDDTGGGLDTFYLYAPTQVDTPEPSWPMATFSSEKFTPPGLLEAGRWEWYGGGTLDAVYAGPGGNVWAGGNGVWRTTNNGTNWNRWPLLANSEIRGLSFWDANRGLALAGNRVYLTEDGGATWRLSYDGGSKHLRGLTTAGTDVSYLVERETYLDGQVEHERVRKSRDGGVSWSDALDPSGETVYVSDLAAHGSDRVWALVSTDMGVSGLYRSMDGGVTWAAGSVADAGGAITPTWLAFADPLAGWLVGQQGSSYYQVWRTTDGGQTWQKQGLGVESVTWLEAVDAKTAWLAAGKQLYRTTDGSNWYKVGDDAPATASFRSSAEGWGINGRAIRRSSDGGATWKTVYTPTDTPLARWWDHLRGWRIDGGIIERTMDGGGTWQSANTGLQAVDHLQMVTPLVGWAWHEASAGLRKTTDGGATWKTQTTGSDILRDLQFVDTLNGWVRDTADNLRRTTDGGASWRLATQPPDPSNAGDPTAQIASTMRFVSAGLGIAGVWTTNPANECSNYFTRTTDGGATWSELQPGPSRMFTFGTVQIGWGIASCESRYAPMPSEVLNQTTNGGKSWSELGQNYMWTTALHAQDAEQLFRFSDQRLAEKSSDGAATFQQQRAEASKITLRSRPDRMYNEEPGSAAARLIYRNTEIPAYRTTRPLNIDGDLGDWGRAWQTSLKASNAATAQGGNPAPLQSSGVLRALWDANNLYLAVQVYDDEIHVDTPDKPWHDDAVELAVDPAHDHVSVAPDADRQYLVNANGEQFLWGAPTTGLEIGRRLTADGYILEIKIPKAQIPTLVLQAGTVAGFNFNVIDDMDGGTAETRLFWTGSRTSYPQANWGQIRLSAIDAETKPSDATPTPTTTATPTETPQPGSYNLSGKVFHDANHNGLLDAGEMGLVSVGVSLYRNGAQIGQTATDGAGSYLFASLPAGPYTVKAQQPPWLPISSTPNEVTVNITNGPATVDFGDWSGLRSYLPTLLK